MKRVREFMIKYAPQKRYYYALCCFVVMYSQLQKVNAIFLGLNHYTYEFGLINPWIRIHNNESMGLRRLAYMLRNSNMGVAWLPQYIFIDAALIFLVMAIINYVRTRFFKLNVAWKQ